MGSASLKKKLLLGGVVATLLILGAGGYIAYSAWNSVNRVTIDRNTPDEGGAVVQQPEDDDGSNSDRVETVDEGLKVFLLIGSDSRDELEDEAGFGDFGGDRADVVMVLFQNGSQTGLLSLPRDLLVEDRCNGNQRKLSVMLLGCETMNGPSLITVTVESLISQTVDHFAMVDLAGFQEAVDAVGGYEICVEFPVRDQRANLALEAGCTQATGAQTLAWLRSRHTQELTEDGWRVMPGVNDLVRNARQRAFLIDMMGRLGDITSPQDMAAVAQTVAPFVTVDSELSITDAVNLALTMRGLGSESVVELDVPVYDTITDAGAAVLLPTVPVEEIVAEFLSATANDGPVVVGAAG